MAKRMTDGSAARPTSKDVSRLAGVSQATVSRAFTNENMLTPETRKRVLDAARQLGYIPNYIARSMVSSKTNLVGIVVFRNESPFQSSLVNLLARELQRRGRYPVVVYQNEGETPEETISNALMYRVDGVFITEAADSNSILKLCTSARVPVVLVSRKISGGKLTSVSCNDLSAGRKAAEYLFRMGHRRIVCLAGAVNASTTQQRLEGFAAQAKKSGMEIMSVLYGDYSYQNGQKLARQMMEMGDGNLPDAVFCTGDIIALGAIDAFRTQYALSIPEDISIIGVDNISEADWLAYSLTTMAQPVEEMVKSACEALIRLVEDPDAAREQKTFECVLHERSSVAEKT